VIEEPLKIPVGGAAVSFGEPSSLFVVVSKKRGDLNAADPGRRTRVCFTDAAATDYADMFH
jgi:hypothetical protein